MDRTIIKSKHVMLYFSTLQIGFGIFIVPTHNSVSLTLGWFELMIVYGRSEKR